MTISLESTVRSKDPITSREAAESITVEDLNEVERLVLSLLRSEPLADHELVARYGFYQLVAWRRVVMVTPQRLRTIRHYLTEVGMVEFAGYYHRTDSGRRAKVWQGVPS